MSGHSTATAGRGLRARVATSPLASLAAFPSRLGLVARYDATVLRQSIRWLVRSREYTNLTYNLAPFNREHLAWLIAEVTGQPFRAISGYFRELEDDTRLACHLMEATRRSRRRRLADPDPRYGLRMGWYALIRAVQPDHVVETGTDKGLGACVIAAALLRNGRGRLTTVDVNPDAGYLIDGNYAAVVDLRVADSLAVLDRLDQPVDILFHEVHASAEQERAEYQALSRLAGPQSIVVSDNGRSNNELARWALEQERRFLCFQELPADHWYPGAAMCIAFPGRSGPPGPEN
jgi:predicted O-methyltransferase YrrM